MKNIYSIAYIMILSLFFVGCNSTPSVDEKKEIVLYPSSIQEIESKRLSKSRESEKLLKIYTYFVKSINFKISKDDLYETTGIKNNSRVIQKYIDKINKRTLLNVVMIKENNREYSFEVKLDNNVDLNLVHSNILKDKELTKLNMKKIEGNEFVYLDEDANIMDLNARDTMIKNELLKQSVILSPEDISRDLSILNSWLKDEDSLYLEYFIWKNKPKMTGNKFEDRKLKASYTAKLEKFKKELSKTKKQVYNKPILKLQSWVTYSQESYDFDTNILKMNENYTYFDNYFYRTRLTNYGDYYKQAIYPTLKRDSLQTIGEMEFSKFTKGTSNLIIRQKLVYTDYKYKIDIDSADKLINSPYSESGFYLTTYHTIDSVTQKEGDFMIEISAPISYKIYDEDNNTILSKITKNIQSMLEIKTQTPRVVIDTKLQKVIFMDMYKNSIKQTDKYICSRLDFFNINWHLMTKDEFIKFADSNANLFVSNGGYLTSNGSMHYDKDRTNYYNTKYGRTRCVSNQLPRIKD